MSLNVNLETINSITQIITNKINIIVIFILILFIGFIIGKMLSRLVQTILKEWNINKLFKNKLKNNINIIKPISNIVEIMTYIITIIIALNQIGFDKIILYLILILIIITLIISLISTTQLIIPNIIAMFRIKKNIEKGKWIEYKKIKGKILKITITGIYIKDKDDLYIIPNRSVLQETIKIYNIK